MIVAIDTSVLLLFLSEDAPAPPDPETREEIPRVRERVNYLIKSLADDRAKIIIPTPVLSEVLVVAGDGDVGYLEIIERQSCFRVAPFDQIAAIEAALMMREAMSRGGLRARADPSSPRAKIKFDYQIVAVAKTEQAEAIYAGDQQVLGMAARAGLRGIHVAHLDLPPEDPQQQFPWPKPPGEQPDQP
ncbi:MAG: hypothetical protein WD100_05880 [Tistlia sp.]|uniref:hypothetical protein n=1 Tax=Tistlia sp. TaxID=3057121 RepID=UPI0034A3F061